MDPTEATSPPLKALNVFFDIQGTLISGGRPRPHAREAFQKLESLGHHVYLWSSAGGAYAASAAELLGVEDLILGCHSKTAPPPVSVDFVVDDQSDFAEYHGGYTIPPFDGDPDDSELWRVVEALRRKYS